MVTPADEKPSGERLERINGCKILTKDNKETTFGQVIEGRRNVVIFIRHWFCVACQEYVKQFCRQSLPPTFHKALRPIGMYYSKTGCPPEYELYADPTRKIHDPDHFDFVLTMSGGEDGNRTDYEETLGSYLNRSLQPWKGAFQDPMLVPNTGSPMQNGGEFIFEADGTCSFAHRMQNAGDHTEVATLANAIGAKVNQE